ncbi:MAG: zinc ribbon domain-containing protein [Myxococcales bacterium]|nr:zinc ribbon domain-containing protein [Myxococcales bacterium]MDD9965144.1 zinc ribbon domain-containing protein [Myxococcales bacterium]
MPLYEYHCARCSKQFEELVYGDKSTPSCPSCAKPDEVTRLLMSRVAAPKKENLTAQFPRIVKDPPAN